MNGGINTLNNNIEKNMLSLRMASKDDLSIIKVWLNKEYIKKWYGEPEEWLAEIRNDSGQFGWLNHYIVMYADTAIGFCQYYDCSQTPKGFEWDDKPKGTFAIDYLIGEEYYLKKGLGSVIIEQLCQVIKAQEKVIQYVADPVTENANSIRLLERNGFILDLKTGLYKLDIGLV